MKKTITALLATLTFSFSAHAGDFVAQETSPETCFWRTFTGGSVGYLNDADTAMYTFQIGEEYVCHDRYSHAFYLEVGYASKDFSILDITVDVDFIPVTFNYKYEKKITGGLNFYAGGGAGAGVFRGSARVNGNRIKESDTQFLGQAFGGLLYNVTEDFEVYGGLRYLIVADSDFLDNSDAYSDDFFYELGVRFNF